MVVSSPVVTDGYVSNGLLMYLKGSDATSNRWVDRVGGHIFTLTNCNKLSSNDGVYFPNGAYGESETCPNIVFGQTTIEIVCDISLNSDKAVIMMPTGVGDTDNAVPVVVFSYANPVLLTIVAGPTKTWGSVLLQRDAKIIHISSSTDESFVNGSFVSKGYSNKWNTDYSKMVIGARNYLGTWRNFIDGNIYAVRVYNRNLTEDEILSNYNVDKSIYSFLN